jgi:hypothetical protein
MKNILVLILLCFTTSSFAKAISYRLDDVDSFNSNGKVVSIEDLRDGFSSIPGVQVSEDTVTVSNGSSANVILRDSFLNNSNKYLLMTAKSGGEMGGG